MIKEENVESFPKKLLPVLATVYKKKKKEK